MSLVDVWDNWLAPNVGYRYEVAESGRQSFVSQLHSTYSVVFFCWLTWSSSGRDLGMEETSN